MNNNKGIKMFSRWVEQKVSNTVNCRHAEKDRYHWSGKYRQKHIV